jgi:uncharacterized protein (TIGR04255 family)
MSNPERTLTKNKISSFIIRIDLDRSSNLDYNSISESLSKIFPNQEIQITYHYNVDLDTVSVKKVEAKKFIFKIEEQVKLEVSPIEKSIIFSSNYYTTDDLYKERLKQIVEVFATKTNGELQSRRIGMRYINSFPSMAGQIPKVLNISETKILKDSLEKKDNLTRLIIVDEYLKEDYRIRVQYGIPNKFYPNVISSKDIILDIDVFSEGLQSISNWFSIVTQYNHAAFDTFVSYVRADVIESLR